MKETEEERKKEGRTAGKRKVMQKRREEDV